MKSLCLYVFMSLCLYVFMSLCLCVAAMTAANAQTEWNCVEDPCDDYPGMTSQTYSVIMNITQPLVCDGIIVEITTRYGNCNGEFKYEMWVSAIRVPANCGGNIHDYMKAIQRILLVHYRSLFPDLLAIPVDVEFNITIFTPACWMTDPYPPPNYVRYRYCLIDGCCKWNYTLKRNKKRSNVIEIVSRTNGSERFDCIDEQYPYGECTNVCNNFLQIGFHEYFRPYESCSLPWVDPPPPPDPRIFADDFDIDFDKAKSRFVLYPVPADNEINLYCESDEALRTHAYIYNSLLQESIKCEILLNKGFNRAPLDIGRLSNGVYFIVLKSEKGILFKGSFVVN